MFNLFLVFSIQQQGRAAQYNEEIVFLLMVTRFTLLHLQVLDKRQDQLLYTPIWNCNFRWNHYTYTDPDSYDTTANSRGVLRDPDGNVSFNTVIASLTGAASLNVLKSGDTMSGDLQFNQTNTGIKWTMNTDGAGIFFKNDGDADSNSYLILASR